MTIAKLVADTNVVSYLLRQSTLGDGYRSLIAGRPIGITLLTCEELRYGAALNRWADARLQELEEFLEDFFVLPTPVEIAEICGRIRAARRQAGRRLEISDAWNAATALWHEIPLVTHDRDLEGIPGLHVLTLHDDWRIGEPRPAYGSGTFEPSIYEGSDREFSVSPSACWTSCTEAARAAC